MILQFKTHILSVLETHTGAIYHATTSALKKLDKLQIHFLEQLGLNEKQAFLQHNLLPLELRRDIAILGFLHKSNLGLNHPGVNDCFKAGGMPAIIHPAGSSYARRHDKPLFSHLDNVNSLNVLYRRSIPNMVHIYNLLPQSFVDCSTVSAFQNKLTAISRLKCIMNAERWKIWLSAREYSMQNLSLNLHFRLV